MHTDTCEAYMCVVCDKLFKLVLVSYGVSSHFHPCSSGSIIINFINVIINERVLIQLSRYH